ncbi:helix-turn-helix transcriptional regulator [Pectobacterium wasabiae]|uniref:AraC family transcriptional regulator n=1 Tax=Pectobacterium wasabiae TaxID=55208 RepID=A0AAW3ELC6_9GAMM|nr:helix-turn-helix transcriptional regulator [Pectobacterium wasabiae]AOR65147.1 AraC family transcriptional regulator [Pectobacterium wasabiae CFBP 3304]EJS95994.1 Bacterial regulatory protein, AraC family [Pectobacterium wasabiae CFBP 3304]KFX09593.1 AraC family transcriptional regulator [Pectobacterium wasabiae]KGA29795.1 AraC family transcriptional regulator [Pectobacterium wasabiae]
MSVTALRPVSPPLLEAAAWTLPSGQPLQRYGLCALAQPHLRTPQQTTRFHFYEATLLLVLSGQLTMIEQNKTTIVDAPSQICLITPDASANLTKMPGGNDSVFRSIFLTFSPTLLARFYLRYPVEYAPAHPPSAFTTLSLDDDLTSTLQYLIEGITGGKLDESRLELRLMDMLLVLSEHGYHFGAPPQPGVSTQLRTLISEEPERHWTAQSAGRLLAMSEATLRRRLSAEQTRFEVLLLETRMQHAMMLVQTTSWSMQRLAEACGYKSSARFSERFKTRFGCSPTKIR